MQCPMGSNEFPPVPPMRNQMELEQNRFTDSPFANQYDGYATQIHIPNNEVVQRTTDPDDNIAHNKQRMFAVSIPREACMCKGFGSSV